ncbi:MAG: SusC/RagA family TonB-linked outer membrane protein [Ginsengibacter sp.]
MKKRLVLKLFVQRKKIVKFFIIMKLIAVLLTIACFQVNATGFSQGKIDLTLKNVQIKKALISLKRNSDYRFIYSDDILPKDKKVTIDVKDATIDEVLNFIFLSTSLTYKVLENNLVVISSQTKDADEITVKGIVKLVNKDGSNTAQAGVSIIEKGAANSGTTTNDNGEFSLVVKDANAVLQISYIGYKMQEISLNGRTNLSVNLELEQTALQEVVVTALGITRQKRSLTYAAQSIKGTDLSNTREVNLTSAMNGKVAGLLISKTNAGPGSSNRIIFRGNRSITQGNQPLIVVDGVRIDNTPKAFTDVTANIGLARDNGDGISNINPDDVESMTVLTGASAAALYGSDAANGAVIITTKKGKAGKGIGVQISSSLTFENPMIYPKLQNTYGQGIGGVFDKNSDDSWGPKLQGQAVEDWTGKTQPLVSQPDNFKDFFRTGSELINSAAISTGTEKSQTYFSYTNTNSNGIIPNNDYKRNNLNLRQTAQVSKNFSIDLKANYIVEDIGNRPMAGAANHAIATLYALPRSLRLDDVNNFETTDPSTLALAQNYWGPKTPAFQNPYWSVYRNLYKRLRNRFIGLVALKYQLTPALSIQARSSIDYYTDRGEEKDYSDSYWIQFAGQGNYIINKESNQQFNNDLLLTYNKNFSDNWSLNVNAGASLEKFNFEGTNSNDQGLIIANSFSLGNGLATVSGNSIARTEKQSLYAAAQIGYNNYLFLDLTGRNDWNSTLPVKHASYFFPSAGLSAVVSDILTLPSFITLLKARTSYAYVGNGGSFNQFKESPYLGPGGNGGFLFVDRTLRNKDLKPEQTRSFEGGLELGLFKNRLGAEVTYYKTNTKNQVLQIGVPNPSGYAFRIINAGNIQNEGIELLLNGTPLQTNNFKWNVSLTYGKNKNKILYLDSLEKAPPLSSPETLGVIVAEEGKSYGGIYTTSFQRNTTGQILVDAMGLPLVEGDQSKYYAGNYNPDWTAGIMNTFQYKNWSLSVLIDERKGGIVISGTEALLASKGVSQLTVANRETGFVIPNSVNADGSKNTTPVTAQDYWSWVGSSNLVGEAFINSATNIRLREASLSYNFSKILGNGFVKGASVSLLGRNLFFLKNDAYGFDPESALGTGNNQGLEYTSVPSTRSYGVYLKFNF